jgi:hypothetical protein
MGVAENLKNKREAILRIAADYGGRNVRLFGSVAKGTTSEDSDVDILVDLDSGRSLLDLVAMKQDLEDLLGRPVHVVTPLSLSPYIRDEVLKETVGL